MKMRIPKSFRRKSKGEIALHVFVSFVFALVALSYVYLFVWAAIAGFKTHDEIVLTPFSLPETWQWKNYLDVFSLLEVNGNNFWNMLFNSLYFSVLCVLINEFSTMSFSYACTFYKFPGSTLPYTIILIMITLPLYGTAGAKFRLIHQLGMYDSHLQILGSLGGMGITFLYYRAYFKNISPTYIDAAKIDGANDYQIYGKIMAPMAKPLFGALFLQNWLSNWNAYASPLIYLPTHPTLPVGVYLFNTEMIYRARLDILFAACVIISLPAIILFIVFNKTLTTSVTVGGIKG